MSANLAFFPRIPIGFRSGRGIGEAFARTWDRFRWIGGVISMRRNLVEMDERMLKDLGISRAQAEFELSQAPWRTPPY
jgi:uncharacterized protein YjiS (DUF1127 family)